MAMAVTRAAGARLTMTATQRSGGRVSLSSDPSLPGHPSWLSSTSRVCSTAGRRGEAKTILLALSLRARFGATLWALHDAAGARRDDGPNKPAWRSHRLRCDFCPPTSKIV